MILVMLRVKLILLSLFHVRNKQMRSFSISALSKSHFGKFYDELAEKIKSFHSIKMLGLQQNKVELRNVMELGISFFQNFAKVHKSCSLKFTPAKLDKAIEKARTNSTDFTKAVNVEGRSKGNAFILLLIFCFSIVLYCANWEESLWFPVLASKSLFLASVPSF